MKSAILSLIGLCFLSLSSMATDVNSLYQQGNKNYENGKYDEAVLYYSEALKLQQSPELHYNIGNAYYKTGQFGQAILNYERALVLKPDYEQARENLSMANTRIVDKIDASARKDLSSFWFSLRQQTGVSVFGGLTLLSLLASGLLFSLFLLSGSSAIKKLGFFSGTVLLIFSFVLLYLTLSTQNDLDKNKWAIVTTDKLDVLTEPRKGATITFVIHEGTKVHVNDTKDNWMEVQLPNGSTGWVTSDYCTEI